LFYKDISKIAVGESPLRYLDNPKVGNAGSTLGRVAAIMPVHQMGIPCDLRAVLTLAREFNIPVIEDAACAIGSEINMNGTRERIGKPHGDISCFSFHPRKVITTGDGGMLTTNNPEYNKSFRLLRQHGMNVSDVARHGTKKVTFEEYIVTGFNYRMTDIQAAVGIEQLKKLPYILSDREKIAGIYRDELADIPWLKVPAEPLYGTPNFQSYPVRIINRKSYPQLKVMQKMLDNNISTRRGIMNSHQERPYSEAAYSLPESESARDDVILLPIYWNMSVDEVDRVVRTLREIKM
ncbi:MAG: DegT/DnrJ/EryC1/StrS family aminotransferase, partial [Planctomycetota bacterium]|jgi:dTDP-4-amino-4,6-dideoxygalactose transaminase